MPSERIEPLNDSPQVDPKLAYNVREAARLLSVSHASLYTLIQREKLRSFQIGSRRLTSHQAILDYIADAESEPYLMSYERYE